MSDSLLLLLQIRESEDEWGVPHAFTLIGRQQSVVVAARYEYDVVVVRPARRVGLALAARLVGG